MILRQEYDLKNRKCRTIKIYVLARDGRFINIIEDDIPQTENSKAAALKLQNELKDYIYEEDGKVKCMVVKKK